MPTPFYPILVSVSVFIALSTVRHSINSLDCSPLSHSVLPVLFLPYWSFQLNISKGKSPSVLVLADSSSRGGDIAVFVLDINQPSLPTPFNSVFVSVSIFMALSTVFHSINFPDNSPFSHTVLSYW